MTQSNEDSYYIVADIKGLGNRLVLNPDKKYSLQTIDLFLAGFKTQQEDEKLNGFTKEAFYNEVAKLKNVKPEDINDIFIVHSFLKNKKTNLYNMTFSRPIFRDNYQNEDIRKAKLNVIKMLKIRKKTQRNKRIFLGHEPAIINYVQKLMIIAFEKHELLVEMANDKKNISKSIQLIIADYINNKKVTDQLKVTQKICDVIKEYKDVRNLEVAILTNEKIKDYNYKQSMYPQIMFNKEEKRKKKNSDQLNLFNDFKVEKKESRREVIEEETDDIHEQYINDLLRKYRNNEYTREELLEELYKLYDASQLSTMPKNIVKQLTKLGINNLK